MKKLAQVDVSWTLFLDRDGVINKRIFGGYILDYADFRFKEGVLESSKELFEKFTRVIVVTNQQCVAKGLISEAELAVLHEKMLGDFQNAGSTIDRVYAALELKDSAPFMRKPHPMMAELARQEFPEVFNSRMFCGSLPSCFAPLTNNRNSNGTKPNPRAAPKAAICRRATQARIHRP